MAGGTPAVLLGHVFVVRFFGAVILQHPADETLGKGREGNRRGETRLRVEDAEFYRPDPGVRANVPPAVGIVVHRPSVHHQVHVTLERLVVREGGREAGAGESLEDLDPARLEAGIHPLPERRVGREREQ